MLLKMTLDLRDLFCPSMPFLAFTLPSELKSQQEGEIARH
jgi:hypothetical protein